MSYFLNYVSKSLINTLPNIFLRIEYISVSAMHMFTDINYFAYSLFYSFPQDMFNPNMPYGYCFHFSKDG